MVSAAAPGYKTVMGEAFKTWATPVLLFVNAALLALVLFQLHAVEKAAPGSPVYCGEYRNDPCYVTVVDAPRVRIGSGRWGLENVDDAPAETSEARRQRYMRMMTGQAPVEPSDAP